MRSRNTLSGTEFSIYYMENLSWERGEYSSFQIWLEFGEALYDSHPVFNGSDPLQGRILWPADRLRVHTKVDTNNLRKAGFLYDVLIHQAVI